MSFPAQWHHTKAILVLPSVRAHTAQTKPQTPYCQFQGEGHVHMDLFQDAFTSTRLTTTTSPVVQEIQPRHKRGLLRVLARYLSKSVLIWSAPSPRHPQHLLLLQSPPLSCVPTLQYTMCSWPQLLPRTHAPKWGKCCLQQEHAFKQLMMKSDCFPPDPSISSAVLFSSLFLLHFSHASY